MAHPIRTNVEHTSIKRRICASWAIQKAINGKVKQVCVLIHLIVFTMVFTGIIRCFLTYPSWCSPSLRDISLLAQTYVLVSAKYFIVPVNHSVHIHLTVILIVLSWDVPGQVILLEESGEALLSAFIFSGRLWINHLLIHERTVQGCWFDSQYTFCHLVSTAVDSSEPNFDPRYFQKILKFQWLVIVHT